MVTDVCCRLYGHMYSVYMLYAAWPVMHSCGVTQKYEREEGWEEGWEVLLCREIVMCEG